MICKFNHDGDCCNSGATQYMCKCKMPCDTIIPITNADRIRAMSDEELANWLARTQYSNAIEVAELCGGNVSFNEETLKGTEKEALEWLQQPAREN